MKIIKIIHIYLMAFGVFAPIKNIKTKVTNLESILSQEHIDAKKDLILFSTSILLKLPERKKNRKLPSNKNLPKPEKHRHLPLI